MTWNNARGYAESLNLGLTLASIESQEEADFIKNLPMTKLPGSKVFQLCI